MDIDVGKVALMRTEEVLCPSMTMVAVCNAVKTVGATPIYVDCGKNMINPGVQEYLARASPKVSETGFSNCDSIVVLG